MIKIYDINSYKAKSTEIFFFDTNIWMFLFCPIGDYNKQKQKTYSLFFNTLNTINATIWINSLVLSEFCNAWLRIEFNQWKKKHENITKTDYKKDFVPSDAYKDIIAEIKIVLPELLKKTERANDNFQSINLDSVYAELENCDFNDSYYLELAYQNKWKIVTDDGDLFKNNKLNVEIITANIR